jgi:hypothetical protein
MGTGLAVIEPRVFVTNFAGHDYTKAEKYGKIVWVTRGYVSFHSLDRVKYRVCEEVDKSIAEDWLLLSGIPMICVVAALYWFWKHKKVKLLIHDKKNGDSYRELIITDKNFGDLCAVLNNEP